MSAFFLGLLLGVLSGLVELQLWNLTFRIQKSCDIKCPTVSTKSWGEKPKHKFPNDFRKFFQQRSASTGVCNEKIETCSKLLSFAREMIGNLESGFLSLIKRVKRSSSSNPRVSLAKVPSQNIKKMQPIFSIRVKSQGKNSCTESFSTPVVLEKVLSYQVVSNISVRIPNR